MYTADAQKLFPHVSALLGFHHQGVFTVIKHVLRRNTMAAKSDTTAPSDRKLYHL
jgi:hypothetical protein